MNGKFSSFRERKRGREEGVRKGWGGEKAGRTKIYFKFYGLMASSITRQEMSSGSNWFRQDERNGNHVYTIPIILMKTHLFSSDSNHFKITRSLLLYKHKLI